MRLEKNGKVIREFKCVEYTQQKYFELAVDIAGGMWNGKDKFSLYIDVKKIKKNMLHKLSSFMINESKKDNLKRSLTSINLAFKEDYRHLRKYAEAIYKDVVKNGKILYTEDSPKAIKEDVIDAIHGAILGIVFEAISSYYSSHPLGDNSLKKYNENIFNIGLEELFSSYIQDSKSYKSLSEFFSHYHITHFVEIIVVLGRNDSDRIIDLWNGIMKMNKFFYATIEKDLY